MKRGVLQDTAMGGCYDGNVAYHMFNAGFPAEEIILFSARLIRIIRRTRFCQLRDHDVEDGEAEAYCNLLSFLSHKRRDFYLEEGKGEKRFHYDCWWVIYYAFKHQLSFNQPQPIDRDTLDHARLPHPRDVDRLNWLGQVADDIQIMVLDNARFTGSEFGACEYIIRAFLDGRRANPAVIKRDFGVGPPEFFIDYCKIMLRKSLYDIRDHPQTYDSLLRDVVPVILEDEEEFGEGELVLEYL